MHPERKVLCMFFHESLGMHHRVRDCCCTHVEERSVSANNNPISTCALPRWSPTFSLFARYYTFNVSLRLFFILHTRRIVMLHNFVTGSRNPLCKHGSVFFVLLVLRPIGRRHAHARVGSSPEVRSILTQRRTTSRSLSFRSSEA